jgi:hypothetical protein
MDPETAIRELLTAALPELLIAAGDLGVMDGLSPEDANDALRRAHAAFADVCERRDNLVAWFRSGGFTLQRALARHGFYRAVDAAGYAMQYAEDRYFDATGGADIDY